MAALVLDSLIVRGRSGSILESRSLALVALTVTTAMWASSFVASGALLDTVQPATLALLRTAVSLLFLLPILAHRGVRPAMSRESALMGLIGVAIFFVAQNAGQTITGPANATLLLNGGLPLMSALVAYFVVRERLTRGSSLCAVLSAIGVAVVVMGFGESFRSSIAGNGLMLIATMCAALHAAIGKRTFAEQGLIPTLAGSAIYALGFLVPVTLVEWSHSGAPQSFSTTDGMLLLYLGVGCSGLAYVLWGHAFKHVSVTQVAVVGNIELPLAVLAAAWLAGDALSLTHFVGGSLILSGAAIVLRR